MRITWHPLARADLAELLTYIASDNLSAAYRLHDEIRKQISLLAAHPELGRVGRVPGTRELVVTGTPFIAAYRVARGAVMILRILHGARLWPPDL